MAAETYQPLLTFKARLPLVELCLLVQIWRAAEARHSPQHPQRSKLQVVHNAFTQSGNPVSFSYTWYVFLHAIMYLVLVLFFCTSRSVESVSMYVHVSSSD